MQATTRTMDADERGLILSCPQCGKPNRLQYRRLGQASFRCGTCHNELPTPAEPVDMPNEAAFDALVENSTMPVLVDFWAPWCGPCKMMAPEFAKVAATSAGQWLLAKVNTEELPHLAERFAISGIPTMVLFKEGRAVTRQSGAMPAAGIKRFVELTLGAAA